MRLDKKYHLFFMIYSRAACRSRVGTAVPLFVWVNTTSKGKESYGSSVTLAECLRWQNSLKAVCVAAHSCSGAGSPTPGGAKVQS